jgi:hypothetical protein
MCHQLVTSHSQMSSSSTPGDNFLHIMKPDFKHFGQMCRYLVYRGYSFILHLTLA